MSVLDKKIAAPEKHQDESVESKWLNPGSISLKAIDAARAQVQNSTPNYVVLDQLFSPDMLDQVIGSLIEQSRWQRQRHTYSALYVDNAKWQNSDTGQRFVQRDVWQRHVTSSDMATSFLRFLRSAEFMSVLSRIFRVSLTDKNVQTPELNTNYFRLGPDDFVAQHADDSPGREVCMLLYLNKAWQESWGGELAFLGDEPHATIEIEPVFNRCVLFKPSSRGSEHWVRALNAPLQAEYRYNVTSWYWSD